MESYISRDLEPLLCHVGSEVCDGSGSQLPILIDVDNQVDAASLMSCLPYFLGKGALRGKVIADQVGSSTKPILMIGMELTHLQSLQSRLISHKESSDGTQ